MKEEIIIETLKVIPKIATTFSDNSRKKKEDEKDEREAELKKREQELTLQIKHSDNKTEIVQNRINKETEIKKADIETKGKIEEQKLTLKGKHSDNTTKLMETVINNSTESKKIKADKVENEYKALIKNQKIQYEEQIKTIKLISDTIDRVYQSYQDHIYNYQATISIFNDEIKKRKRQIESKKEKISKEEESLVNIQNEIVYKNKIFDTLQHEFEQKIKSIKELKFEYKETMNGDKYQETLGRKQRELDEVLDKIEDTEISLLNKELERINLEEKLQPKRDNIAMLEESLVELEDKKEHFENIGLNKPLSSNKNIEKKSEEYIEDVDVSNEKKNNISKLV